MELQRQTGRTLRSRSRSSKVSQEEEKSEEEGGSDDSKSKKRRRKKTKGAGKTKKKISSKKLTKVVKEEGGSDQEWVVSSRSRKRRRYTDTTNNENCGEDGDTADLGSIVAEEKKVPISALSTGLNGGYWSTASCNKRYKKFEFFLHISLKYLFPFFFFFFL